MNDQEIINLINTSLNSLSKGQINKELIELKIENLQETSPHIIELLVSVKKILTEINESYDFIISLSKGELETDPPARNYLISPFKQLQSNLRHLTWQTIQIASGDYNQKVSFLGDFSIAFNQMIEALKEKKKIEDSLKVSEQNLRELNDLKDKMFSIIAHDLRGPIGTFKNLIDLLLDNNNFSDVENTKEFLSILQKSSGSVFNLLENLLTWAMSQRDEIKISLGYYKIADIIDENITLFHSKALNKKINLYSTTDKSFIGYFDYPTVNTVFRNLISNALKFTRIGGEIKISGEIISGEIHINITDNGIGISEENMTKLFDPKSHFTTKGTEKESGSGLGLIICRDFIIKNNGQLNISSKINEGTNFEIILPSIAK